MNPSALPRIPVAGIGGLAQTALWQLWYLAWQPGSVHPDPDQPVFVSLTDFQIHHVRHAPSAWRTGLKLRRSWPRLDGAIGLWLWSEPWKLRSGAISIWRSHDDLLRFIRSPAHRAMIRRYNNRMSGTSSAWHAPHLDRPAIWTQAMDRLNSSTVHAPIATSPVLRR
jgi:hypothetical protein